MRSKSFLTATGLVLVLALAAAGLAIYDSKHKNEISKGITVNGIDIGGLSPGAARARLTEELASPLQKPIEITFKKRTFTLTPEQAKLSIDIDGTVQQAMDESRDGNMITRSVRGLTGGSVDEDLVASVTYDKSAIADLAKKVKTKLTREPVDASVDIGAAGVTKVEAQPGRSIKVGKLRHALNRQLLSSTGDRSVAVKATKIKPKVTTEELASKYPSIIIVNRSAFTLHLYENLQDTQDYRIAVGMAGLETPAGQYAIQDKQVDPYWHVPDSDWAGSLAGQVIPPGPSNPIKARWMGIYNGAGIHGTDADYSLGTAASHGCIRMAIPDVENLYDRVDIGTPVYIS
jgi:lipoprotein-anchoring transpeptidase ErfK/SrfK